MLRSSVNRVAWWFDFAVTALIDDGHTVRTEFRRGQRPERDDTAKRARRLWKEGASLGVLTITYADEDRITAPARVQLELAEGITPSFLSRFPWSSWITAADEYVRSGSVEDPRASEALSGAIGAVVGRPGRRGHDPHFLEAIAHEYRRLRAAGERAPVATIANAKGVSRNTAAGWIKQARQRGLLAHPRRSTPN
jgi:hypothetical protein